MDIPNLRQHFLSDNLKILRRPTPKQENSPYLPILLKVMMVEERITFAVHLKVSDGEKGKSSTFPILKKGKSCSAPGWNR